MPALLKTSASYENPSLSSMPSPHSECSPGSYKLIMQPMLRLGRRSVWKQYLLEHLLNNIEIANLLLCRSCRSNKFVHHDVGIQTSDARNFASASVLGRTGFCPTKCTLKSMFPVKCGSLGSDWLRIIEFGGIKACVFVSIDVPSVFGWSHGMQTHVLRSLCSSYLEWGMLVERWLNALHPQKSEGRRRALETLER